MTVLTIEECAKELKVSSADVVSLIDSHELDARKIGEEYRIPFASFQQYLGLDARYHSEEIESVVLEVRSLCNQIGFLKSRPVKKILLSDVLDEVLALKSGFVTSNTLEWNKDLAKHLYKGIGARYIDELTPKDIQEFYNAVSLKPDGSRISHRLLQGISNLLTKTLKYAVESQYTDNNPITSSIRLPKTSTPDPHKRFMDYNEISELLSALRSSEKYSTLVKLLVMSGLRIGEALGLFWSNIDMVNCVIHVRQAVVREYFTDASGKTNVRYVISSTKTPESVRDVPVVPQVISLLRNWKVYLQCQEKLVSATKNNKTEHLVFPNQYGHIQNCNTFQYHFRKYLQRHGAEQLHVTFHRLRHSYGSFLLEQGEQLITVSRLLGHKNIRVTADIYCTVTTRVKNAAVQKTSVIWDNIV